MHSNLLTLPPGIHAGVQIRPRWPARYVHVDAHVLSKLQAIQTELPAGINLILTRGYEPRASGLGFAHWGSARSACSIPRAATNWPISSAATDTMSMERTSTFHSA